MSEQVPSAESRHVSPYAAREKIARMGWAITQGTVFRFSFHSWNRWRVFLLNRFGARVHPSCIVRRTVRVECPWNLSMGPNCCLGDFAIAYCLGPVTLGARVTVSQYGHLCAGSHDHTRPDLPLLRPPITIGDDVWIAADAFVGPSVTIGDRAVLAARSTAVKDLPPDMICAGSPAIPMKERVLHR